MPFQLRFILFVNQFLHMSQKNCHNIFILLTLDQSLKNVITLGIPSQKKSTIQKVDMCPASYSCSQGGGREIHFNAGDLLFNFTQHESILQCNQSFFLFLSASRAKARASCKSVEEEEVQEKKLQLPKLFIGQSLFSLKASLAFLSIPQRSFAFLSVPQRSLAFLSVPQRSLAFLSFPQRSLAFLENSLLSSRP